MDSSEEASLYALNWSHFDQNLKTTFSDSRPLRKYSDITFLCQDRTLYGHKIVLHAASDYFRELFEAHPAINNLVIYMYHVKGTVLKKLLEYMYCGDVQIEKKHLQEFIMLGQNLKVKGLVNRSEDTPKNSNETKQISEKRKHLENCILAKNKKNKLDKIKSGELTAEAIETSTDEETKDEETPERSANLNPEDPLENVENNANDAIEETKEDEEEQEKKYTSNLRRSVTKSYTRYRRLVANIKKTEIGPHEMTKGTRRRCGQCSIQKVEKRTSFYCQTCNIALCRDCFEPFHKTFDGTNTSLSAT